MAIELPLGTEAGGRGGLAAFVAATGQSMLTTNASAHHAHNVFPFTQCARAPPASMMLAPVFLQGFDGSAGGSRVAMVLEVGNKDDGGSYNRDDVVLLSSLASCLSSVLEHVESNERAASQANHLLSSSGAIVFMRLHIHAIDCNFNIHSCPQRARPLSLKLVFVFLQRL
jgi:hypothetical protein